MNIKKFYLLLIIAFTFWAQNAWGQTYKRINSTSDLVAGDKYIITSAYDDGSTYILGYQKTNNRDGAPTATISSGIISSLTIAIANTNTANAYEITLGGSTGAWTLNDTYNGYLYAASSSNNYLKTQATNNANGQWAISFSSNVASIVAQGTNTRKVMQYNYNLGSPLFTCYSSASQAAVYLFRRAYTVTYVGNGNDGGSVPTDASSPYFSGATVTVKANTGSLTKTGYTFAGWDSNNDGTADFTGTGSETFIMSSSNVTLKAVWSSSGSTPPTLTAAGSPTVDAAFDVTFTDDATWRAAITGITIGGTPLTAGWSASSGTITFTPSSSTPAGLLQTAGSKSIVVTATGYSNATVSQDIGFGAAAKLGITQQPTAPASNGAVLAQQPVVVIQDQYGNTVTSSSASVNAAVGSGTWTIGGTSSISASSGVATFTGLTATSAAAVTGATINFSSSGLTGITSGTFNIPAPPPPTLTAAVGATVDGAFDVTFTDNASWRTAITSITINGTPLTAGWDKSNAGKITFTPSSSTPASLLQTAGSKSIVIAATGYSNATVTQSIGFGAATKLGITQQPTAPASNGAVLAQQPVVVIQDQYGNTVTSSSASVNAAVGSGTWTIGGTTNPSASSGVATFTNLTATSAAAVTGATINFSSSGLTGITSNTFNIPAPAPANDLCGSAVALTIDAVATSGTLTSATYTAFTNASNKNDVWYKFTPACSGNNTITVTFSSGPDIDFEVFSNSNVCPTNNNQRVVNANSSNATSETNNSYTFLKGVTYYIRVLEYSGTASNFDIRVTSPTSATQAVTTNAASSITASGATLNGQISTLGVCPTSNGKGFVYAETSVNSNPVNGGTGVTTVAVSTNVIPQTLTAYTNTPTLTAATGYSYKAYVIDEDGNYTYGAVQTFTTLATEPTAVTGLTLTATTTNSISLSWTNGNGAGRIVVARLTSTSNAAATSGTDYTFSSNSFTDAGNGTTGTGNKVVYKGTGNSVTISDLNVGTSYGFYVYEYNGSSNTINYASAANLTAQYTLAAEPTVQATISSITPQSNGNLVINFAAGTGGTGRMVVVRQGSAVDFTPDDANTSYDVNANFSSGAKYGASSDNKVVYANNGSSVTVTGLTPSTAYYVAVFEYNSTTTPPRNYLTTLGAGNTGNATTFATQPTAASAVTLTTKTTNSISLSWTNGNGVGRIVVARLTSTTNAAAVSGTDYTFSSNSFTDAGNGITGTGNKVVYKGTGNSVTISDLNPGTSYGFYVYEYNGSSNTINYASAANLTSQYTLSLEPSAHAASFTATATTSTNIALSFSAANTITNASGYLILRKSSAFVAGDYPVDGNAYAANAAVGSNGAVVNTIVTNDATTTASYGASADQTWYFLLVPYNWDGANGATRNYNTNPTIPTSNTTTPSGVSDVVAVASSSPATISSIINDAAPLTSSTGVQVWQITIRDGGAGMNDADLLPTKVSGITFTAAGGNGVTWNTAIKTAALFNGSTFIATASSITATNIVFSGLSISVADNSSATYSLRISLNETLGTGNDDGKYFIFQLSQANITTVADGTSSSTTNFTAITTASGGTENKIDVVATQLAFVQQPTDGTAFNNITPAVTVQATDANGNIDLDFTAAVAITATGSVLKNSPVSQSSVSGLATFSNLQFVKAGTGVTLTATSGSLTNAVSNGFNITLGSPIVALAQWTFETSVPTSAGPHSPEIGSGQATGNHASGSTTYNNPVGNGSAESFSSDRWASGDYYQFKTSSYGYQNITLSFDQTGSDAGPRDFKIQYSTDGSTFTDLSGGSYQLTKDSWSSSGDPKTASSRTFDLSSVTALNNQANIYIRLTVSSSTAIYGGSIATTGTGRVDNVTIKGAAITFTWNGAGDGINWNDAANWDCNCGLTPTINNPVVIPNGANVVLNTDYTARNLQLQATSSLKIAPNKILTVEGYADFNGQHVTVQSDATGTGMIGQVTGLIDNATNVTVERYISASSNRAYRMLTPSVTTTNYIRDNWQEGTNNPDKVTNNNPNPGYGTHITGAGGSSNGFDVTQTNQSSLFKLVSGAWVAVGNTNATKLYADQAYLLFVRGSRDNINTINTASGSSNTTLRATGTLKQGAQTFASLPASDFSLVSNPFAAPINWANVYSNNSSNFENYITIWDPNVGTRGGYVTVNNTGTNNNGGSYLNAHIQSGQAFYVITKSGGAKTLNIAEADKSTTNNLDVYKDNNTSEERLNILLRFKESATNKDIVADGVLARFDATYSNEIINAEDAEQITNWDEDIALQRGGKKLSIESRKPITTKDTLFLQIANLKAAQSNYRWVMAPQNFATDGNLVAFLEDAYTGSRKAVSLTDSTTINFTVNNNAGSTAANRFRIVFTERTLYYSKATNIEASDVNSWSSTPDGTGNSPANFDEVANFIVQQNHKLQATNNIHLTQGSLTLQPYAGINHTATISLTGNIENNGSLTGTGVVILNASIPQYISGTGSISNLKLDNTTGAVIKEESKLYISSSYTPTAGVLTTHNNLVLQSTETQTASINKGNTAGNYLKGDVRIERYIPSKASRKWSFITSPITQSIATGWQQQIHITGAGTGGSNCPSLQAHSNGYDATPTHAASIFTYDASKLSGQRWQTPASTLSDFTTAGKAFRVNTRGDRNLGCSLLDGTNNIPSAVTLYTTGSINNENNNAGNFSISYPNVGTDNYIFIGNPYPSGISFSALQTTNSSNIHNNYAVYIPSNAAGVYTYWDALSNSFTGGTGYDNATGDKIVSGQALFVQSKTAGNVNLSFTEDMKVEVNSMGYFRNNNNISEKIKISYLQSNDTKIDETVIRYLQDEKISNTQKGIYDIPSMNSGTYISSLKGATFTAVQSRSLQSLSHDEVWLNIGASQSGSYQLSFSDYEDFTAANIYLIDHLTNTTQNIKENATYMFSVDANNAASKGATRFSIVFNRTASNEVVYNQIKMYPNPADKQVSLLLPQGIDNGVNYQIKLTDITGKIVMQRQATGGKEVIDIAALTAGIYIVEITDSKGKRVTEKLVKN